MIFRSLHQLASASEKAAAVSATPTTPLLLPAQMEIDNSAPVAPSTAVPRKEELVDERQRYADLRTAAWTAFRLLATQAVGWEKNPSGLLASVADGLHALQQQVTELVCAELSRGEAPEASQLLSLLFLLCSSSGGFCALAKPDSLERLVVLLVRPTTTPCAKRLLLRLCRKLLPALATDPSKLVDALLHETGKLLVPDKDAAHAPSSDQMELDKQPKDKPAAAAEEKPAAAAAADDAAGPAPGRENWAVYLTTWTQGQPRLVETCMNTVGPELFGSLAASGGAIARVATDARVRQIMSELDKPDGALLKSGTRDECNRIAQGLAAAGASVTVKKVLPAAVAPAAALSASVAQVLDSPTKRQRTRNLPNAVLWTIGHVRHALASEHVALLRFLLRGKAPWADAIRAGVRASLQQITGVVPNLADAAHSPAVHVLIAAVSLAGGFTESIRVGARVEVNDGSEDVKKLGTVVEYVPGSARAEVVFDADHSRSQHFDIARLRAVPEFPAHNGLYSPNTELIRSLLSLLHVQKPPTSSWLFSDLRARALKALNVLLDADTARLLVQDADAMSKLRELGASAKAAAQLHLLEGDALQLAEQYSDAVTRPGMEGTAKPMAATLPHSPCSQLAVILPTCFERSRLSGLIFIGDDRRNVECAAVAPGAAQARGGARWRPPPNSFGLPPPAAVVEQEVLVLANLPVPPVAPAFYFEVTIEKAPSNAIISVGFCPERMTQWGEGSYRYQANSKRTTFVGGARRQDNYGSFFRAGNVVGAWFNRDEKTITFTRDGEELGVAFRDVAHGFQLVPVVGLSTGVRVRINFGQEPFLGKVEKEKPQEEVLDPEAREKKRLELEAKRKKEREEEEARRKKEQQDLENQRKQAAQPIMAMATRCSRA